MFLHLGLALLEEHGICCLPSLHDDRVKKAEFRQGASAESQLIEEHQQIALRLMQVVVFLQTHEFFIDGDFGIDFLGYQFALAAGAVRLDTQKVFRFDLRLLSGNHMWQSLILFDIIRDEGVWRGERIGFFCIELVGLQQQLVGDMQDLFIELFSGVIAGWSLVTTGMPLDLIKTKLQLNKDLTLEFLINLMEKRGGFFPTFYRGASSMYTFIGLATALEFTVFQTFSQFFSRFDIPIEAQLMGGGFMAGMASSLIQTPIEFAKIRTQLDQSEEKMGSMQRLYYILKKYRFSGLKKIYTGLRYTMMKQGPGLAMYFGGFHVCMMDLFGEKDRENAKITSQIGSAFIAGLIYNLWGYPFDTFKTNVQSGASTVKSLIQNKFWQQRSYKQGMIICVLRGLIVDSTNLTVYERTKNFMTAFIKKELH